MGRAGAATAAMPAGRSSKPCGDCGTCAICTPGILGPRTGPPLTLPRISGGSSGGSSGTRSSSRGKAAASGPEYPTASLGEAALFSLASLLGAGLVGTPSGDAASIVRQAPPPGTGNSAERLLTLYLSPSDVGDVLLTACVEALLRLGNRPTTAKELMDKILGDRLVPPTAALGGPSGNGRAISQQLPMTVINNAVSRHAKRCSDTSGGLAGASRPVPVIAKCTWESEKRRKTRYYLTIPSVPVFSEEEALSHASAAVLPAAVQALMRTRLRVVSTTDAALLCRRAGDREAAPAVSAAAPLALPSSDPVEPEMPTISPGLLGQVPVSSGDPLLLPPAPAAAPAALRLPMGPGPRKRLRSRSEEIRLNTEAVSFTDLDDMFREPCTPPATWKPGGPLLLASERKRRRGTAPASLLDQTIVGSTPPRKIKLPRDSSASAVVTPSATPSVTPSATPQHSLLTNTGLDLLAFDPVAPGRLLVPENGVEANGAASVESDEARAVGNGASDPQRQHSQTLWLLGSASEADVATARGSAAWSLFERTRALAPAASRAWCDAVDLPFVDLDQVTVTAALTPVATPEAPCPIFVGTVHNLGVYFVLLRVLVDGAVLRNARLRRVKSGSVTFADEIMRGDEAAATPPPSPPATAGNSPTTQDAAGGPSYRLVCVMRRRNNNMVNASSLLFAAGIGTPHERQIALALEKDRVRCRQHTSAMYGTWIPVDRAQSLASSFLVKQMPMLFLSPDLGTFCAGIQTTSGAVGTLAAAAPSPAVRRRGPSAAAIPRPSAKSVTTGPKKAPATSADAPAASVASAAPAPPAIVVVTPTMLAQGTAAAAAGARAPSSAPVGDATASSQRGGALSRLSSYLYQYGLGSGQKLAANGANATASVTTGPTTSAPFSASQYAAAVSKLGNASSASTAGTPTGPAAPRVPIIYPFLGAAPSKPADDAAKTSAAPAAASYQITLPKGSTHRAPPAAASPQPAATARKEGRPATTASTATRPAPVSIPTLPPAMLSSLPQIFIPQLPIIPPTPTAALGDPAAANASKQATAHAVAQFKSLGTALAAAAGKSVGKSTSDARNVREQFPLPQLLFPPFGTLPTALGVPGSVPVSTPPVVAPELLNPKVLAAAMAAASESQHSTAAAAAAPAPQPSGGSGQIDGPLLADRERPRPSGTAAAVERQTMHIERLVSAMPQELDAGISARPPPPPPVVVTVHDDDDDAATDDLSDDASEGHASGADAGLHDLHVIQPHLLMQAASGDFPVAESGGDHPPSGSGDAGCDDSDSEIDVVGL